MIDTGLGGLDLLDLTTKCIVVIVLLFITLRVLGRMQAAGPRRGGKLEVLESRSIGQKASLHLVAVGDRRLVVGLTPSGLVSLTELKAEELEAADFATAMAEQEAARGTSAAPTVIAPTAIAPTAARPLIPAWSPLNALVRPIDAFADRLAAALTSRGAR